MTSSSLGSIGASYADRIFSSSAFHWVSDITGCVSTMLAEWQIRHSLLIASAVPPPANVRSLSGKTTLTERSVMPPTETDDGADAPVAGCAADGDWAADPVSVASIIKIVPAVVPIAGLAN